MTDTNEKAVLLEKRGEVAWITLNRPEKLNSINDEVRSQLPEALAEAEADEEVRVIVLQGAGEKAFCAGADVAGFKAVESLVGLRQSRAHAHWISAFDRVRKPIIAAVQGYCLGGGCELALACDMIVASETATFGQPEIRLGIIPGGGGTQRLARVLGKQRAMEYVLTGKRFDAETARGIADSAISPYPSTRAGPSGAVTAQSS